MVENKRLLIALYWSFISAYLMAYTVIDLIYSQNYLKDSILFVITLVLILMGIATLKEKNGRK